jgi:hypothetical protein
LHGPIDRPARLSMAMGAPSLILLVFETATDYPVA